MWSNTPNNATVPFEQVTTRTPDPAHRPGVQIIEQLANGDIQRLDGKELPVAQAGKDPALHYQHRSFDLAVRHWA